MKDIKIAFFDIDGTLVDMLTKEMSEKTKLALLKLRSKGIMICIATGRSPMGLPDLKGVTFDVFLTFNGSFCFHEKEKIYSHPISHEDVEVILNNAAEMKRPVSIATSNRLVANGKDRDLIEYYGFAKVKLDVAEDFYQVAEEEVYQVMMSCRKEEYSRILKNTKNAKIAAWWDRAVDIIPADSGKGTGIRSVLDYYHLKAENAIAFGDGNNDIEMFEAVGTSVAMGNASDELKEIATDICGCVSEDGIYHYCVEHHLI